MTHFQRSCIQYSPQILLQILPSTTTPIMNPISQNTKHNLTKEYQRTGKQDVLDRKPNADNRLQIAKQENSVTSEFFGAAGNPRTGWHVDKSWWALEREGCHSWYFAVLAAKKKSGEEGRATKGRRVIRQGWGWCGTSVGEKLISRRGCRCRMRY